MGTKSYFAVKTLLWNIGRSDNYYNTINMQFVYEVRWQFPGHYMQTIYRLPQLCDPVKSGISTK